MNGFLNKLRYAFMNFMSGRYGADKLNLFLVYGSLILIIIAMFSGLGILSLAGDVMLIWAIFRMFSKNLAKRQAENERFTAWIDPKLTSARQACVRFKNRKIYRYVKCPACKSISKLPRGTGEVTVTCGKCGNRFKAHG